MNRFRRDEMREAFENYGYECAKEQVSETTEERLIHKNRAYAYKMLFESYLLDEIIKDV